MRPQRSGYLADFGIGVVLLILAALLAFVGGCEAKRACVCPSCGCSTAVSCETACDKAPTKVESPDLVPLNQAKPAEPDKLIGAETKSKAP